MKWTHETIGQLKLVSYEKTKAEAQEAAKDHEEQTGRKCVVFGSGRRARNKTYDKPWQVRETGNNVSLTRDEALRLLLKLTKKQLEAVAFVIETADAQKDWNHTLGSLEDSAYEDDVQATLNGLAGDFRTLINHHQFQEDPDSNRCLKCGNLKNRLIHI